MKIAAVLVATILALAAVGAAIVQRNDQGSDRAEVAARNRRIAIMMTDKETGRLFKWNKGDPIKFFNIDEYIGDESGNSTTIGDESGNSTTIDGKLNRETQIVIMSECIRDAEQAYLVADRRFNTSSAARLVVAMFEYRTGR